MKGGQVSDKRDFAIKIGISPSMVTEISKGRSNVGTLAIQNIVSIFDINADWLLTGRGEMLKVTDTPAPSPRGEPKKDDFLKLHREAGKWERHTAHSDGCSCGVSR